MQLAAANNPRLYAGELELAGTLDVTLQNGFTPTIGEQFTLLQQFAGFSGTFANVNLPPLDAGGGWDTSQLYTTGVITVVPEPASIGLILLGASGLLVRRRR
jgi:hypothetical protein